MYLICHTSIRAHHSNSKINCLTIEHCNGSLNCEDVPNSPKKSMMVQSDFIKLKNRSPFPKNINNQTVQKPHETSMCDEFYVIIWCMVLKIIFLKDNKKNIQYVIHKKSVIWQIHFIHNINAVDHIKDI